MVKEDRPESHQTDLLLPPPQGGSERPLVSGWSSTTIRPMTLGEGEKTIATAEDTDHHRRQNGRRKEMKRRMAGKEATTTTMPLGRAATRVARVDTGAVIPRRTLRVGPTGPSRSMKNRREAERLRSRCGYKLAPHGSGRGGLKDRRNGTPEKCTAVSRSASASREPPRDASRTSQFYSRIAALAGRSTRR